MVLGLGLRVLRFKVQGSGFWVFGFWVLGLGLRVLSFKISGSGFRVLGF